MRMISFMTQEGNPYTALLVRNRRVNRTVEAADNSATDSNLSAMVETEERTSNKDDKCCELEAETSLLQLLNSRRQSALSTRLPDLSTTTATSREEVAETTRALRSTDRYSSTRARDRDTERSASRSRFSVRRLDLHATPFLPMPPVVPPNPASAREFGRGPTNDDGSDVPRWSVRRFACEACSQKWRDRSSINNVKNSGLKKNSSKVNSISSVTAPARLQTSILSQYTPHPAIGVEIGRSALSGPRSIGGVSWQLRRARRSRPLAPTPCAASSPSPHTHSTDPRDRPSAAAAVFTMPADPDRRVNSFLNKIA